jgi:hypothetical protein
MCLLLLSLRLSCRLLIYRAAYGSRALRVKLLPCQHLDPAIDALLVEAPIVHLPQHEANHTTVSLQGQRRRWRNMIPNDSSKKAHSSRSWRWYSISFSSWS